MFYDPAGNLIEIVEWLLCGPPHVVIVTPKLSI